MTDFFEGAEKTLMVEFSRLRKSLRDYSDAEWAAVLRAANVEVLSTCGSSCGKKNRRGCTAFLLSESSLFVYPNRIVLKTCGETTPIHVLPGVFDLAGTKRVRSVVYSHPSLVMPEQQEKLYTNFETEVEMLEQYFDGERFYLGTKKRGVEVYVANYLPQGAVSDWVQAEVYVRDLDLDTAMEKFSASGKSTMTKWWKQFNPDVLDEFQFEPYGYSANALTNTFYTTTHATPQASCSYFSCATNAPLTTDELGRFVQRACAIGEGKQVSIFLLTLSPLLAIKSPAISGFAVKSVTSTTLPESLEMSLVTLDAVAVPRPLPIPDRDPRSVLRTVLHQSGDYFDTPVMLIDSEQVKAKLRQWQSALPQIQPHYAIKCNPALARPLARAQNDPGFDVASEAEIKLALEVGASPENLVYSNPCKQVSSILFAKEHGVSLLVFDNAAELEKIASVYPGSELLLRVQTDDVESQCPMSMKFGCPVERCHDLLVHAQSLNLTVVGVSFHVGSGCSQEGAFTDALSRAHTVFEDALELGFEVTLLDIGGGFPGCGPGFSRMAKEIVAELSRFPAGTRMIAEPGRFFAHAAGTLCAQVIAEAPVSDGSGIRYYLNDGLYGSFNCLLYDHATVTEGPLRLDDTGGEKVDAHFFGPTCDGFDSLFTKRVPKLNLGEWLMFPQFGAYTNAAASGFNGMKTPSVFVF